VARQAAHASRAHASVAARPCARLCRWRGRDSARGAAPQGRGEGRHGGH
jgi:hypothetical protein